MTTAQRAEQLSDATFSGVETAFLYMFTTPAGWVILGVVGSVVGIALLQLLLEDVPNPFYVPPMSRRSPAEIKAEHEAYQAQFMPDPPSFKYEVLLWLGLIGAFFIIAVINPDR